jgi:ketosteroid isomerase-like protein
VSATPRAAVDRYLAALNAHDPDAAAAAVTDDFVNEHTSARGVSVTGRAAYRERLDGFLAAFQDLRYEPVDGRPVRIRGMFRFTVRDGLIARRVDYWDGEDFRRQTQG